MLPHGTKIPLDAPRSKGLSPMVYIFQPLNCLVVSLLGIIHAFLFDMQPTMASGLVSLRHLLHSIIAFVDIQRWRGFPAWGTAILAARDRRSIAVRMRGGLLQPCGAGEA